MSDLTHKPEVNLTVSVDAPLERLLERQARDQATSQITSSIEELLQVLGIPGQPVVAIVKGEAVKPDTGRFLQVRVSDQVCRYPDEMLLHVWACMQNSLLAPDSSLEQVRSWLEHGEASRLLEFTRLACLEILKQAPGMLLQPLHAAAYLEALPVSEDRQHTNANPDEVASILKSVLDLRISLADRALAGPILWGGLADEKLPEDIAEALISALRPESVEIRLSPAYLRQITSSAGTEEQNLFSRIKAELFDENGVIAPTFRFVTDSGLQDGLFSVRLNHLEALPRPGLKPDEYFVVAAAHELPSTFGLKTDPVAHPLSGGEASLIRGELPYNLPDSAITWSPLRYLVLVLKSQLKSHARCYVNLDHVREQLYQLELAYPAIVSAANASFSSEQITRLLRHLAAEDISIRDLRSILSAALDLDYIVTDPLVFIVLDDRLAVDEVPSSAWLEDPANLASFVRMRMKRALSHKYTRGSGNLDVYLLSAGLEQELSRASDSHARNGRQGSLERQVQGIILRLRKEHQSYSSQLAPVAILTTAEIRPFVRELLAPELPRLPVLAYQELTADINIRPVDRLSASE